MWLKTGIKRIIRCSITDTRSLARITTNRGIHERKCWTKIDDRSAEILLEFQGRNSL